MASKNLSRLCLLVCLVCIAALTAKAQSFRVQCPQSTITHPLDPNKPDTQNTNNFEPPYNGPTQLTIGKSGYEVPTAGTVNGAIRCQQISGGDGFATMADGTQMYLFAFGPLSALADIAKGHGGSEFPKVFNSVFTGTLIPGDPATTDGANDYTPTGNTSTPYYTYTQGNPTFTWNGAVGQVPDPDNGGAIDGHVDPRPIMDVGSMNGEEPNPLFVMDEDDEFFLTLTNVGMVMRPDLFEQHTVHYHGYPNASTFYDGVPEPSIAINIGGSFTYYYLAPDAGTYMWHCHITPPEHLQMGMVGQVYVRPRQDRVPVGDDLYTSLTWQEDDPRTACHAGEDILCSNPLPKGGDNGVLQKTDTLVTDSQGNYMRQEYAYNDGDGTTAYDVEYPINIHSWDPNFHFIGMTFNPENFAGMKDKYFTLNGRGYPDTVTPGPIATQTPDGSMHYSQPMPTIINIPVGGRALLRFSDLDVTENDTLATLGIPMTVVGRNAKLLRDEAGNNLYYTTNSVTLGGGESMDVILDASDKTKYKDGQVFFLYTPNLDHLSNDAENFGGHMTEIHICATVTDGNTFGNKCD